MSDNPKFNPDNFVPDQTKQQELRDFALSRQTHALITVYPNCGHSYRIPVILRCFTKIALSERFVLVVQPTDQAAAYASRYMQKTCDSQIPTMNKTSMSVWLDPWMTRNLHGLSKQDFIYVSARQFLSLDLDIILRKVSWIVMDEVHRQSAEQELALAVIRKRILAGSLGAARVAMLSAYLDPSLSGASLLPGAETLDIGHLLGESQPQWDNNLSYSRSDLAITQDSYLEYVLSIVTKAAQGPILIMVPSALCFAPLKRMLEADSAHRGRGAPWKVNQCHLDALDEPQPLRQKGDITLSLPFFHTQRECSRHRYVICPHWMRRDMMDFKRAKVLPGTILLTRAEIIFMASHATRWTFLSCTKKHYTSSGFRKHAPPLLHNLDPIGYYLQAHKLFPQCAQYQGLESSLPVRIFHPQEHIFWVFHRLITWKLVERDVKSTKDEVVLTERGKSTALHMLHLGLEFKWATFIEFLYTFAYESGAVNAQHLHQGLIQAGLPLALMSTFGMSRVLSWTKEDATASQKQSELLDIVKDQSLQWGDNFAAGDIWHEALLLSLHLRDELIGEHGGWRLTLPRSTELRQRFDYSMKSYFMFRGDPRSMQDIFRVAPHPDLPEGASFCRMVNDCFAGSRLFNLALVKWNKDDQIPGQEEVASQMISGFDIASGRLVSISMDSIVNHGVTIEELNKGQSIVCYDEHRFARSSQPNNQDGYILSGVTPILPSAMGEVFEYILQCDGFWKDKDNIRAIIGYPFDD